MSGKALAAGDSLNNTEKPAASALPLTVLNKVNSPAPRNVAIATPHSRFEVQMRLERPQIHRATIPHGFPH